MTYSLPNNNVTISDDQTVLQLLRPLQSYLNRQDVTEITINRPGEIWIKTQAGWHNQTINKLTQSYLQSLTTALIVYNGLQLNSITSVILPGGQRGQIVVPPACIEGTLSLSIRKHSMAIKTLDDLVKQGIFDNFEDVSFNQLTVHEIATIPTQQHDLGKRIIEPLKLFEIELLKLKAQKNIRDFLEQAVLLKRNIVISGKTGSGKTTFARSLIEKVPITERIITIEDVHELFLLTHPNRVHLLYGDGQGRLPAGECLASCMRQSPDRIFLAELRGGEAWDYLNSLNTGHPGAITTTHANGALQTFERIITLIKKSEIGQMIDVETIRRVLYSTIDIILYFENFKLKELFYDPIFAKSKIL